MTEYTNLAAACSEESYYECLAKRFHGILGRTGVNAENLNGSQCSFHEVCSPFTLPFGEIQVPLCQNDSVRRCYEEKLIELEADQDIYCKKSCNIKEFVTEERDSKSRRRTDKFGFRYQFEVPIATKDHMSHKPLKTVKKEYLITNEISLIGNVGGTLGMFVGFSFIGTIEWLLEILSKAKNHMN